MYRDPFVGGPASNSQMCQSELSVPIESAPMRLER